MSRLVKGSSVNLGTGNFVLTPRGTPAEAAPHAHKNAAQTEEQQARARMQEAERYAAELRRQAQKQAEEIREQARTEGFREGFQTGKLRGEAEYKKSAEELTHLVESLDRGRQELFKRHEQELIDLALDIARKVVADRIERDDEAFLRIFKKAVEGLSGQKIVKLHVSEHELEFATAHADYLRQMIPGAEKIDIQLAEGAPRGTLIVDTEENLIDASTERQLEIIGEALSELKQEEN